MKRLIFVLGIAFAASVSAPGVAASGMTNGPSVPFGNGTAHAWYSLDASGHVQSLGVAISADALKGMEARKDFEKVIPLPASLRPFHSIVLGWNQHGHPPEHVYDLPHFDVHYYTITEGARMAMMPKGESAKAMELVPPKGAVPAGFMAGPAVPMMGKHWVDPKAAEFHGQRFGYTFIFGSYAGKTAFLEQMLTAAYLRTHPSLDTKLAQPPKTDLTIYPRRAILAFDNEHNEYVLGLRDFKP